MGLWQAGQAVGGKRRLLTLAMVICGMPAVSWPSAQDVPPVLGRVAHAIKAPNPNPEQPNCGPSRQLPGRPPQLLDRPDTLKQLTSALRSGQNVLVEANDDDAAIPVIAEALHRLEDQHQLPDQMLWLNVDSRPLDLLIDDLLAQSCHPASAESAETRLQQLGQQLAVKGGLLVLTHLQPGQDPREALQSLLCSMQGVQLLALGTPLPESACPTQRAQTPWTTVTVPAIPDEDCHEHVATVFQSAHPQGAERLSGAATDACALLGGQATAIHIAGQQLRQHDGSLASWVSQFRDALRAPLRVSGTATAPAGQRRVAALFLMGLRELSEAEQALLLATGLLPPGSPLPEEFLRLAAGLQHPSEVRLALRHLDRLGLLQWDEIAQRYRQLDAVRDEAERRLRQTDAGAKLIERAATAIASGAHPPPDEPPLLSLVLKHLAQRYREQASQPGAAALVAWAQRLRETAHYPHGLNSCQASLAIAYGAAVQTDGTAAALTIAQTVAELAQHASHTGEALQWYMRALAHARRLKNFQLEGEILEQLGRAHQQHGELDRAIEYLAEAFHVGQRVADPRGQSRRLSLLADAYLAQGESRMAIANLEQALVLATSLHDREQEARNLGQLGIAYRDLGHVRRAIEHHEKSLGIARELGASAIEEAQLESLGVAHRLLGDTDQAAGYLQRALHLARVNSDSEAEKHLLTALGETYLEQNAVPQAIACYEEALGIARNRRDRIAANSLIGSLAAASHRHGDHAKARAYYEQAIAGAQSLGDRSGEGQYYGYLGELALASGQPDAAVAHLQRAVRIASQIGDVAAECGRRLILGDAEIARRNVRAARAHWQLAMGLLVDLPASQAGELQRTLSERLQPATASATAEAAYPQD